MKTLSLLLLGLAGLGACTSTESREPSAEQARDVIPSQHSYIPLQFAVAAEVARALHHVNPEARVFPDERTNSVLVACATEAELRQLSDIVAGLDIPSQNAK